MDRSEGMQDSFYKKKLIAATKWMIYIVLVIFAYVLQSTPSLFQIMGAKPLLILPLVITIACYEGNMAGGLFAILGGLLWDISANRLFGFNAAIVLVLCVASALLIEYYMRLRFINIAFLNIGALVIHSLVDFLFYYAIWDYEKVWSVYLSKIVPQLFYTIFAIPIIYLLVHFINSKYIPEE